MALCFPLTQECSPCIYYSFLLVKNKEEGQLSGRKEECKAYTVLELSTHTHMHTEDTQGGKYKTSGGVSMQRDQWEDSLNCKAWLCTREHNTGSDSTHTPTEGQAS